MCTRPGQTDVNSSGQLLTLQYSNTVQVSRIGGYFVLPLSQEEQKKEQQEEPKQN